MFARPDRAVSNREDEANQYRIRIGDKPDDLILALVLFGSGEDATPRVCYVWRPFQREPDFGAASVNYALKDLLASAEDPRMDGRQVRPGAPEQP